MLSKSILHYYCKGECWIMKHLYQLVIYDTDLSYDNYRESFDIGYFSTCEKAAETAKQYISTVQGFRDHPCQYEIIKKNIRGDTDSSTFYVVQGWNVNENLDEVDIIESDCFTDKEQATRELETIRKRYLRSEFCINRITADKCDWIEGFVRVSLRNEGAESLCLRRNF